MKKIGTYTVRGRGFEVDDAGQGPIRIPLFDGRFDTGYRVTSFQVWSGSVQDSYDQRNAAKLGTTADLEQSAALFFDASDQREIAWAGQGDGSIDEMGPVTSIIDPDNMVVEDLFVYLRLNQQTGAEQLNYIITMDKYDITDWQGALCMVRNKSQG